MTHRHTAANKFLVPLLIIASFFLVACGPEKPPATSAAASAAAMEKLPADLALADIYQRSCRSCHVLSTSGAPLTGDTAAWQPRMEQGMDTLLQHVIEGFGGMPPLGLCFECDEQQFQALIEFMAN